MSLVISIPVRSSLINRPATVQIVCDSTTNEPRRLVVSDGYKTASVMLDEATTRQIVDALTSAE